MIEDISDYKQTGYQLGSNPGGVHYAPDGSKHYVKFYNDPEQAKLEVAAGKIHNMLGIRTLNGRLVTKTGKIGIANEWKDLDNMHPDAYKYHSNEDVQDLTKIYHAAVLTKNWDVLGQDSTNTAKHNGRIISFDHGGTFTKRAMGGYKEYGSDIAEHDGLRNPNINRQTAHAFKRVTLGHERNNISNLNSLTYDNVKGVFDSVGHSKSDELAKILLARRDALVSKIS